MKWVLQAEIWHQVKRLVARGQSSPRSSTIFASLTLYYNNLLPIGPRAMNLAPSSFIRWDESNDTQFCPKGKFQNLTSGQIWVTDQVRQKWVILCIIWFGATRQILWFQSHSSISSGSKFIDEKWFPHRVIMGRMKNWPDLTLRSQKWKILDIHSVGIYSHISPWKLEIIRTKTAPTARSFWSQSRGAHLTLTWVGDLTFWPTGSKFARKVCFYFVRKYSKHGGAARRRY